MERNKKVENEKKIIMLLKEGATLEELKEKMNYNDYQLSLKLSNLENRGYIIKREYYSDKVLFKMDYFHKSKEKKIDIQMENSYFQCLMIADTHIGAKKENLDSIKSLYQFASQERMSHVFHLGDFIEGLGTNQKQRDKNQFQNTIDNVAYAIKKYPKVKGIHTTMIFGDHDQYSVFEDGFSIDKMIMNKRADINVIGYTRAILNILNKRIMLEHPTMEQIQEEYSNNRFHYQDGKKFDFVFRGHLHRSDVSKFSDTQVVYVPCLKGENTEIGAWRCNFFAKNNQLEKLVLKPLVVFPNHQVIEATSIILNYETNNLNPNQNQYKKKKR